MYDFLKDIKIGEFTTYFSKFKNNEKYQSIFIKESYKNIDYIKKNLSISMKANIYRKNGQVILLVLIKLADSDKLIYGRWFDYTLHRECLEMILFQHEIPIIFVGEEGEILFTAWTYNDLKPIILEYIKILNNELKSSNKFYEYINDFESNSKSITLLWKES
ncbi:hypothetical protein JCM1393_27170 [Clostridium carnis]